MFDGNTIIIRFHQTANATAPETPPSTSPNIYLVLPILLLHDYLHSSTSYSHRWSLRRQIMTSTSSLNRSSPSLPVCPPSFSLLPARLEVLMVPKSDVGGSETHDMNTLPGQSERKSNDSGASAVSPDQNPEPEVLPGTISQDGGTTLYLPLTFVCQLE
jgi:hypothetical protein